MFIEFIKTGNNKRVSVNPLFITNVIESDHHTNIYTTDHSYVSVKMKYDDVMKLISENIQK